jgi:hypothetical protein
MRKSLWMLPVVLLITALGSTSALADTIACGSATCITSGGYVTGIEGLNIDGTLYDVTFGATDDLTFATNGEAGDAAADIATALGTMGIVSSGTIGSNGFQDYCVDRGGGYCTVYNHETPYPWFLSAVFYSDYSADYNADHPPGFYFAEFAPAVATPEPGSLALTLTGVGLLGLMVVMRKRKAPGLAQAT